MSLKVGFSKVNINPPLGIGIRGYYIPRYAKLKLTEHITLQGHDLKAVNTAADPHNVEPKADGITELEDGKAVSKLQGFSWNVIRFVK